MSLYDDEARDEELEELKAALRTIEGLAHKSLCGAPSNAAPARSRLFALSLAAQRPHEDDQLEIHDHRATLVTATGRDDAMEQGIRLCQDFFPEHLGWYGYNVSVFDSGMAAPDAGPSRS